MRRASTLAKVTELVRGRVELLVWLQSAGAEPQVLLPTLEEAVPYIHLIGEVVCGPRRMAEGDNMVSIQVVITSCQFYLCPKHL